MLQRCDQSQRHSTAGHPMGGTNTQQICFAASRPEVNTLARYYLLLLPPLHPLSDYLICNVSCEMHKLWSFIEPLVTGLGLAQMVVHELVTPATAKAKAGCRPEHSISTMLPSFCHCFITACTHVVKSILLISIWGWLIAFWHVVLYNVNVTGVIPDCDMLDTNRGCSSHI